MLGPTSWRMSPSTVMGPVASWNISVGRARGCLRWFAIALCGLIRFKPSPKGESEIGHDRISSEVNHRRTFT